MKSLCLLLSLCCFCFAPLVLNAAAPNIQGSVEIDVQVGNVINTAEAANSVAQVSIGSISTGDMGDTTIKIVHGDVVNTATGIGSCAQVLIGSIGVPSCVGGSDE